MANPLPLVSLSGYDLSLAGATFSMDNEDPDYPASNLGNGDPAVVAKSTANSDSVSIVTPDNETVVAVAFINTNATQIGISSGGPIPPLLTPPALDVDGQRVHGWMDLRDDPLTPSSLFAVGLVAPSPVWIGHIALLTAIEPLNLKYGLQMGRRRPGDIEIMTRGGSRIRMGYQVRTRWAKGMVDLIEDAAFLHTLEASAKGTVLPFIFIPDENTQDAWMVTFNANDFTQTIPNYDVREIPLAFEELSSGPPNG